MENANWLPFAQITKTEEIIQKAEELKGKFDSNDTVEVQKRGSKDPVKVLRLAAQVAPQVKEAYAPLKAEVIKIALSILKDQKAVTTSVDTDTDAEVPQVPSKPNTGTPVGTVEHSEISRKIASDLGMDLAIVEKVTGSFVSQVSGSFVLGLVALANSLHFIASSHDKMPGHEARVKAIDDIRKQYVEAGTLTSRKSRS